MTFTHLTKDGQARMVDISSKPSSSRAALAEGRVRVSPETIEKIESLSLPKGNPFEVARIAGIQAAKQTASLIPLCHSIDLDHVDVEIRLEGVDRILIRSRVRCRWATGVEMEALTAVSVAALTIYDMCKAVDSQIVISEIRLLEKTKS